MQSSLALRLAGQADTYPITGIKAGVSSDKVPLRVEVDSWYPPTTDIQIRQVNLFILALLIFQETDPAEKLSYFQIAGKLCYCSLFAISQLRVVLIVSSGIHGSPFMPWDEETDAQTFNEGYCTHDSLLFPCWHRPYVLLVEVSKLSTLYLLPPNRSVPNQDIHMR